jgi:hypothetical protein
MDESTTAMHLAAGEHYGQVATCDIRFGYMSEEGAVASAEAFTKKYGNALEAYPCFWCKGWHIARPMTPEEIERFSA